MLISLFLIGKLHITFRKAFALKIGLEENYKEVMVIFRTLKLHSAFHVTIFSPFRCN
jgi:hypothetical protein